MAHRSSLLRPTKLKKHNNANREGPAPRDDTNHAVPVESQRMRIGRNAALLIPTLTSDFLASSDSFRRVHAYIDTLYTSKASQRKLFLMINPHLAEHELDEAMSIMNVFYPFAYALDDIVDNTMRRGGKPTAHVLYGVDATYFTAFIILIDLVRITEHNRGEIVMDMVMGALSALYQPLELRASGSYPSLDRWTEMVRRGWGIVYQGIGRLVFPDGRADEMMLQWATYTALCSDYNSLWTNEYHAYKETFCEDLENGEHTFPIAWAVSTMTDGDQSRRLATLVQSCPKDRPTKQQIVHMLEQVGAKHETVHRIKAILSTYPQFGDAYRFFRDKA